MISFSEKEILQIEEFGPHNLLYKIAACKICERYLYKEDMRTIRTGYICDSCSEKKGNENE